MATKGLVRVGDFGFTNENAGGIYCKPADRQVVKLAYDAIDEDNMRDDVLDDVRAAGGVLIQEPANARS